MLQADIYEEMCSTAIKIHVPASTNNFTSIYKLSDNDIEMMYKLISEH